MDQKKLLLNERVEVRQFEEGLRGSWHTGVVVGISDMCRTVQYDELLSETGNTKLMESIAVTEAIEGLHRRRHVSSTYRGHIRPLPPPSHSTSCSAKLEFGVCVDAFFEDAWWEGVVIDCEEDVPMRSVYFPDEGDVRKFNLSHLRVSCIWDEYSGVWTDRGVWVLLELVRELEGNVPSSKYIKKLWSQLRTNYEFMKMVSEWTCGVRSLWKKCITDVCAIGSDLGMKNLARKKVVVCKISKRRDNLNNAGETKLDSNSDQLKNQSDLKTIKPTLTGEEALLSRPRKEMHSMMLRSKSKYLGHLTDHEVNEKGPSSDTLKGTGNINQINATMEGGCVQMSSGYPVLCQEKLNSSGSIDTKQFDQIRLEGDGSKSQSIDEDNCNQLLLISSREHTVTAPTMSNVRTSNTVSRRSLKKLKRVKQKFDIFCQDSRQRQCISEAFAKIGNKRKRSARGKRNCKGAWQVDITMKPLLKHGEVDALRRGCNLFSSQRCKIQSFANLGKKFRIKDMVSHPRKRKRKRVLHSNPKNDTICFVCHYGGELIHCFRCLSSYHLSCLQLKVIPSKEWFCPSCCCGMCGLKDSINGSQEFTNACFQCTRRYHINCLDKKGHLVPSNYPSERFCSNDCYKLHVQLHLLLGMSNHASRDGLTWTLIRSMRNDYRTSNTSRSYNCVKLSHALKVIQESFEPIIEQHTKRDLVRDIVYSSVSRLKRLDFRGFYVMVLQKDDEIASAATVRILGPKIAEMPLVATCFQFRRQGMCRILVHELEKLLVHLGVERLVLPAATQVRTTWEASFGFSEMPISDRLELLGYPLLGFHGTSVIQKFLPRSMSSATRASQSTGWTKAISSWMSITGNMDQSRFCGLCYKRKLRNKSSDKENEMGTYNGIAHPIQHVYKRRRILAGRD